MRIGYFDCFSGASGDMILGACLDAGLPFEELREALSGLSVSGYTLKADRVRKQGFAATQFDAVLEPTTGHPHRHLKHVREIIEAGQLSGSVRERAIRIFTRLAEVEAAAHDTTIEKVHFHEVGAIDAIVDIVGACVALERLGIEKVVCSPIPTGSGTVKCEHGIMPVPAPATAALLQGVPLADCDEPGELTTPTGAAILTTLASEYGGLPAMALEKVGIGAGRRDGKNRPNILRLLIGTAGGESDAAETDEILILEANLDDASGELIGHLFDRLFEAGALDVYLTPIYMKKNRPASQVTVLAEPARRDAIEAALFAETTTFGVRSYPARRRKLARSHETVQTEFGPIRIKVGRQGDRVITAAPEYEDCREAAVRSGRPLREVMELARRAWQDG
jgi:uncharacterized protein (TIGR00299 family) protein